MKRVGGTVLFIFCIAFFLGCVKGPTVSEGGGSEGEVKGNLCFADGTPAPGATVTFITVDHNPLDQAVLKARAVACTTTTDHEGVYAIDTLLPAGYYNVFGELDSLKSYLDSAYIPEDDTVMLPTDTLKEPGMVQGTIKNAGGDLVGTATIVLLGSKLYVEQTSELGGFKLANLAEGRYRAKIMIPSNDVLSFEYRIVARSGRTDTIDSPFILVSKTITAIHSDYQKNVWVGTADGLARFDGTEWRTYGRENGLCNAYITAIASDSLGHVWVGTQEGLNRFDQKEWQTFGSDGGLASLNITALAALPEGILWVGNANGFNVYDGTNWIVTEFVESMIGNLVTAIAVGNGVLWVGTNMGLSRYNGLRWETLTKYDGLASNYITSLTIDSSGRIWVGTFNGLCTSSNTYSWQTITKEEDRLVSNSITSLVMDHSSCLWVGTTNGLSRFDGSRWESYNLANLGTSSSVKTLAVDADGDLWIGTARGMAIFNGKSWEAFP